MEEPGCGAGPAMEEPGCGAGPAMEEPGCGAGPAMEEPGCGAQFRAAVQVIQGLPRSGAYRPSYEEMLRFYSYYKQATAGRCQGPRPGFWDPIGRYKWDAWHSLGAMSKEEAMAAYVAEMKKVAQKVIDTVPMDESTREMFRYFEPLYEVIHDMPRPPEAFFRSTAESQGQQDGTSQDGTEGSPAPEIPRDSLPGQQNVPGPGLAPGPEVTQVTSDSEGDTFSDTPEQMEPEKARQVQGLPPKSPQAGAEPPEPLSAGQGERGEGRRAEGSSSSSSTDLPALGSDTDARLPGELEAQVAGAVRALQEELRRVRERLSRLETLGAAQGQTDPGPALAPQAVSRWRLPVSPRTLLFLATWPFVTQWLLRHWQGRKR